MSGVNFFSFASFIIIAHLKHADKKNFYLDKHVGARRDAGRVSHGTHAGARTPCLVRI